MPVKKLKLESLVIPHPMLTFHASTSNLGISHIKLNISLLLPGITMGMGKGKLTAAIGGLLVY